jgi:hypothetical protein
MKQNNCERKMNLREAAQQALEALCLPCDRWNRRQTEIINASEQYRKEKDKIYKRKKREAKKKCTNTKQQ